MEIEALPTDIQLLQQMLRQQNELIATLTQSLQSQEKLIIFLKDSLLNQEQTNQQQQAMVIGLRECSPNCVTRL